MNRDKIDAVEKTFATVIENLGLMGEARAVEIVMAIRDGFREGLKKLDD